MAALCLASAAQAADSWDNRFVPPPDTDGEVITMVALGNDVYAGGSFSTVNGIYSPGIAKWNGSAWESVGGGTDGEVYSLAVNGNNVYLGGSFSQAGDADAVNIAVWNGSYFTNLAAGLDDQNGDAQVNSILVSGTNLFAAGFFTMSDTNGMTNVAKWNGTSWSPVGATVDYIPSGPDDNQSGYVVALAGNSTNLFAAGFFNVAGTKTVTNIARWNGTTWTNVGAGLDYNPLLPDDSTAPVVNALALQGTNLYAGGTFNISGATEVDNFAVWNGTSWSLVGGPADDNVNAIVTTTSAIYIAGDFSTIDSVVANGIARWTNSHWEPLGSGVSGGTVDCVVLTASNLYAGGTFTSAGSSTAVNIARWNNFSWNTVAVGSANAPVGDVNALLLAGTNVFVGGNFNIAGPVAASNVAIWNGANWTNVGTGVDGVVYSLAGNSTNLIAGGAFHFAGAIPTTNIARWNGVAWNSMGNGLDGEVDKVLIAGTNIFIGGLFQNYGSNALNYVAQWNGTDWVALGGGLTGECYALAQFGNNLYAGGFFTGAGAGTNANYIAQWDGQNWTAVGVGADGPIYSLLVSGNNLYASGQFQSIGGTNASNVARFDGTNWYQLGNGISGDESFCNIAANGSNIFAIGNFDTAGTNAAANVAKWTGQDWIPLAGGLDDQGWCIAADATNLYVGGDFTYAGDSPSYHFGIWNDLAPNVWLPPLDGQVISAGSNLTFSASATGVPPISYQWYLNGTLIAGATNSTYTKTNAQSTDMGNYTLFVSNQFGAFLTDPASVQLDSVVVFSDNFESGTLSNWTTVKGATALTISTNANTGQYGAMATNSSAKMSANLGLELEGHARATFWINDNMGTQMPWFGDVRDYGGGSFGKGTLSQLQAIGLYPANFGTNTGDFQGETLDTNRYQGFILAGGSQGYFNLSDAPFPRTNGWHKFQIERQDDPTVVDYLVDDNVLRETSDASGATWDSIAIGSSGSNAILGNVWFDNIRVEYLDPPDILTNPVDVVVNPGASATFSVVATGNVRSYQWLKNDTAIAGATKSSYTLTNAQQAANYSVLVGNGIGVSQSDDAALSINSKPTILAQPQNITLPAGSSFALQVIARGVPTDLSYQWRKNGTAITGAVLSELAFVDAATNNAGSFSVVITNVAGAITSAVAVVTITNSLPVITAQPANQNVNLGGNATFLVTAAGSQPRTYQWRFNGTNINAATNSFYRRANIQSTNAGSYSVVVSNSFGRVTSADAVLTINFPPTITAQPQSQTVNAGSNVLFQVQATGTAPLNYQWLARFVGDTNNLQPIGDNTNSLAFTADDVTYAGTYSVLVYNMAGHAFSSNVTLVVNGPPVILSDPQNITVSVGSNAVFAVSAVGPSLTYQWTRNGAPINRATNSVYVRTNVQPADLGLYAVLVSNSYGSTTSADASLFLDSSSVFFDNFESGLGNWTTVAGAKPLTNSTTQKHSGTNSALCGSSSNKMFHNLPFPVEGRARATFWIYDNMGSLSNWFGEMRSYVGSTNGQPMQILGAGVFTYPFPTNATGQFAGLAPDTNNYQGFVLNGPDSGYFNFGDPFFPLRTNGWHQFVMERYPDESTVDFFVDSNYMATANGTTVAYWDSVFIGSAGSGNTNGNVWFDDIKVEYLDPPVILADPADVSVNPGQGAFFSVSAHGNVTAYQWRFNGTPIANATNSSYSVANAQTNNAGAYSVIVLNNIGPTVSADAQLTIVPYPPTFTFTTSGTEINLTLDNNCTIYSSTNLIDWIPIGTNASQLTVPFTNQAQFFKATIP